MRHGKKKTNGRRLPKWNAGHSRGQAVPVFTGRDDTTCRAIMLGLPEPAWRDACLPGDSRKNAPAEPYRYILNGTWGILPEHTSGYDGLPAGGGNPAPDGVGCRKHYITRNKYIIAGVDNAECKFNTSISTIMPVHQSRRDPAACGSMPMHIEREIGHDGLATGTCPETMEMLPLKVLPVYIRWATGQLPCRSMQGGTIAHWFPAGNRCRCMFAAGRCTSRNATFLPAFADVEQKYSISTATTMPIY